MSTFLPELPAPLRWAISDDGELFEVHDGRRALFWLLRIQTRKGEPPRWQLTMTGPGGDSFGAKRGSIAECVEQLLVALPGRLKEWRESERIRQAGEEALRAGEAA